jgi:hypothetical protein
MPQQAIIFIQYFCGTLINSKPWKLKSTITNCFILYTLTLTLPFISSAAQHELPSFATASPSSSTAGDGQSPAIVQFTYSKKDKKITLNWVADKNQDMNMFEIEKSSDGKDFKMAALVFGTEKTGDENYKFFEKAVSKKVYYRIKMVGKDNTVRYSQVLIANR